MFCVVWHYSNSKLKDKQCKNLTEKIQKVKQILVKYLVSLIRLWTNQARIIPERKGRNGFYFYFNFNDFFLMTKKISLCWLTDIAILLLEANQSSTNFSYNIIVTKLTTEQRIVTILSKEIKNWIVKHCLIIKRSITGKCINSYNWFAYLGRKIYTMLPVHQ